MHDEHTTDSAPGIQDETSLDDDAQLAAHHLELAQDPERGETHYNIGLIHKYRGEWQQSLQSSRRAAALMPDDEASHWNMGIAATALRDWAAAREAWRGAGIEIEPGEGPVEARFGIAPVRLNPNGGTTEVVWGQRIDPVRVLIESVPYPASGFRCGDIVLHDGAPVGERQFGGRTYPVFNVLELFEASGQSTFEVEVRARDRADLGALCKALDDAGVTNENWTTNIRTLCRQCSEGLPHDHHDNEGQPGWPDSHLIGISAMDPAPARQICEAWSRRHDTLPHRLTGRAASDRLLRFEQVLAGATRH